MKTYQIELLNRSQQVITVAEDQFILDGAEAVGLRLPVGCRYGACVTCAARLIVGEVAQPQAVALKPAQVALGYVLLCVAYPRADCQFEVGLESQKDLYVNPFKGSAGHLSSRIGASDGDSK
ncbi:2Fe-2S iron-sulfur cluster-binding protein [Leptolyngbya sp. FACHB-261]|uniref:2Fe-2S iron-sulfur cluster-binding protein n=1 Tax=Leptolyngbya sp. FACHB-261 TaxID=2692806 RepID=UPI0016840086|nr:2Fe-2S iron-sulfur cluster-binding protein [Leptolyngbya sp. FACHB-261]MBD2100696.1 2Fe-2S iron-sulfur cluster binding domain-containing protein [Leptolyngbya sp. FACHB-261]